MNRDRLAGRWKQWSGVAMQGWGRLLRDERRYAEGRTQYCVGLTQERCGRAREIAERRVRELRSLSRSGRH